uniref:Transcriptional regulator n=1 Tax=Archaeoglobus fulgidus TaxID=2234 RepID=A0A7C2NCY6_ARCFL
MDAGEKIKHVLERAGEEGILQSEISSLTGLSKSTVSETLSGLEDAKEIVRKKVSGKSYRVWLVKYSPEPVRGVARIGILRASEYPRVVKASKKQNSYMRVYESSIEITKDLVHGVIDIAASPFITQAFFGILMKNITIVRKVALNGGGLVFSNSEAEYWGCSEFSTMERNLRKYFDLRGIKGRIRYFRSPENMIRSLAELRAIAIWEPYFTILEGRKELFSEQVGDYLCCTLAVNNSFAECNPDLLENFLKDFDRARVRKSDGEAVAELIGFPAEIVARSFENYDFYPEQEFKREELEELRFGRLEGVIRLD